MSENKLRLVKELLESFKANRELHEPFVMSFEEETDKALEWAIKQAERTQELEELINEVNEKDFNLVIKLQEQNKRYRMLLERVCQVEDLEDVWDIEDDYRALEGEE